VRHAIPIVLAALIGLAACGKSKDDDDRPAAAPPSPRQPPAPAEVTSEPAEPPPPAAQPPASPAPTGTPAPSGSGAKPKGGQPGAKPGLIPSALVPQPLRPLVPTALPKLPGF
jgi:hypothetical protein